MSIREAEAIRTQVQRICHSPLFARSGRLQRLLEYVSEETIQGRAAEIKEYRVALDVYERPESYDPNVDSLVRVEVSKLRSRLTKYYEAEGKHDPVRIGIEKGRYVPSFEFREGVEPVPRVEPRRPSRVWWAALLILSMAGVAAFLVVRHPTPKAPPSPVPVSIAVLPLRNLSADPTDAYFAEGMTDMMIGELAQFKGLRVTSRTSTQRFKDTPRNMPEIGRLLSVTHLVEGTVAQSGGQVRITAQLIDAAGDRHIWAESYERNYGNVFDLQREVASRIARAIAAAVHAPQPAIRRAAAPVNRDAFEAYLLGKYHAGKRDPESLRRAIPEFQAALQKDPGLSLAYVGLADAYSVLGSHGVSDLRVFGAKAEAAAAKAVEIQEDLPEAHVSLASMLQARLDWTGAEREYRRALDLSPSYAQGHHWYAELLAMTGRKQEALAEIKTAWELDPLSVMINAVYAISLCSNGRDQEADSRFQHAFALEPGFLRTYVLRASCLIWRGQYPEAARVMEQAPVADNPDGLAFLGYSRARSGDGSAARRVLSRLDRLQENRYVPAFSRAAVFIGLGENDRAFEWLDKAADERSFWLSLLLIDPIYDPLRGDPRFRALLQRMNLDSVVPAKR